VCVRTELTAIYVTARTGETQHAAKTDLDAVIKNTDRTLAELAVWPPADTEATAASQVSPMFRSRHMFAAILAGHRASVRVGAYFWDEVDYGCLLGSVVVGRRTSDRKIASSTPGRCIAGSDGVLEDMSLAPRVLGDTFSSPWPWPWPCEIFNDT